MLEPLSAEFNKDRGGAWAKASELESGKRAKIVDEATRSVSQFKTVRCTMTSPGKDGAKDKYETYGLLPDNMSEQEREDIRRF